MKSKDANIKFLLGTATNKPTYKFIIDYPDSSGVRRKVTDDGMPLPYNIAIPAGMLQVKAESQQLKDEIVNLK